MHGRLLLSLTASAALLLGAACSNSSANRTGAAPPEASDASAARSVPFETLAQGDQSNYAGEAPKHTIAEGPTDFEALWASLHQNRSETPPLPPVDFSKSRVVAVYLGAKRSGGFDVEVQDVTLENDTATVEVFETEPGPGCMATMALTSPYHVVKVEATPEAFAFERQQEVNACDG